MCISSFFPNTHINHPETFAGLLINTCTSCNNPPALCGMCCRAGDSRGGGVSWCTEACCHTRTLTILENWMDNWGIYQHKKTDIFFVKGYIRKPCMAWERWVFYYYILNVYNCWKVSMWKKSLKRPTWVLKVQHLLWRGVLLKVYCVCYCSIIPYQWMDVCNIIMHLDCKSNLNGLYHAAYFRDGGIFHIYFDVLICWVYM